MLYIHKKKIYLFDLKFKFLKFNYLCFLKHYNLDIKNLCNRFNLDILKLQSDYVNKIFSLKKNIFLNHYLMVYFNDFALFSKFNKHINIKKIYLFSYSGFFINNYFIKKLNYYYIFYNNNFKLYTFMIYMHTHKYIFLIFFIILKIIYIINTIYLKLKIVN